MNKKQVALRVCIVVFIFFALMLAIFLPLHFSGMLSKIDSPENLKQVILSGGAYSYFIFIAIQFLQVVILPIPAMVTTIAGALVFGPLQSFIISTITIIFASIFSFSLGKIFGKKLLIWCIGEEKTEKWTTKLLQGKYVFFLMMLFPVFPDDILCLVSGTTKMSYKFFILTNIITRPIGIVMTCYLGSGSLIPFTGWGIPVWIILSILIIIALIISFKFQVQIENKITQLGSKFSKKSNSYKNKNSTNDELSK
ncbi:MAG: VTT domain-containing protein [Clostridia bacterium]